MNGKKLLESFLDGKCPVVSPPVTTEGRIRFPVPEVHNPRVDVPVPETMQSLPVDERGYRVPYFVSWLDGKPDFRITNPEVIITCIRKRACWICGQAHLCELNGTYAQTFVVGPMCTVNRVSAEPGSHLACARYAARVCPFLIAPSMRRNEKDMPEDACDRGSFMIKRNPGVTALWTTNQWQLIRDGNTILYRIGDPHSIEFWREGRHATRPEVLESVHSGLPILQAEAGSQGPEATAMLARMIGEFHTLIARFV